MTIRLNDRGDIRFPHSERPIPLKESDPTFAPFHSNILVNGYCYCLK